LSKNARKPQGAGGGDFFGLSRLTLYNNEINRLNTNYFLLCTRIQFTVHRLVHCCYVALPRGLR